MRGSVELQIACSFCRKTIYTDVKFLNSSDFLYLNLNQILVFRTLLNITSFGGGNANADICNSSDITHFVQ